MTERESGNGCDVTSPTITAVTRGCDKFNSGGNRLDEGASYDRELCELCSGADESVPTRHVAKERSANHAVLLYFR